MALQGTIRDFALPDIFQLIGIQRKTGVLTLTHGPDTVTIKFLEGSVVEADTASDSLENRLGTVLVRTGRITDKQLVEALEVQTKTLQRLGHILVKNNYISQDTLVDALQIQSSQIIYRLFRWREGRYHFDAVEKLDYDETHSTPVSSETILMEGARMVDEWPIIERRIPSDKIVVRRMPAVAELDLDEPPEGGAEQPDADILNLDLGLQLDLEPERAKSEPEPAATPSAPAIKLSPEERQVLAFVDGRRTVREIVDRLALPEFETFRALSDMLTRNLVERVEVAPKHRGTEARGFVAVLSRVALRLAIAAVAVLGLAGLPHNPVTPWRLIDRSAATEQLRLYAAMARLERLEHAVQVFYLDAGTLPPDLATLADNGYVDHAALTDPWDRAYRFAVSPGGYTLEGHGPTGQRVPELTVSRSFSEAQRLLLDGEAPTP